MKKFKKILFFLSLIPYIFILLKSADNASYCNASSSMPCFDGLSTLVILIVLFSPILICCVIYDVYYLMGDNNKKKK